MFDFTGVVYLFQKTAERAHSPANLWEKTRLSSNYAKALEQVRVLRRSCQALPELPN